MMLSRLSGCCSNSTRPGSHFRPIILWRWPFRRSASTSSTREPPRARVRARFAATVDFPSFGTALVMSRTLGRSPSTGRKSSAERRLRYDSAYMYRGSLSSSRDMATSPCCVTSGSRPTTASPIVAFTSITEVKRSSRTVINAMIPPPKARPPRIARANRVKSRL